MDAGKSDGIICNLHCLIGSWLALPSGTRLIALDPQTIYIVSRAYKKWVWFVRLQPTCWQCCAVTSEDPSHQPCFIYSLCLHVSLYIANLHCHHELCQFEYISTHPVLQPSCNCFYCGVSQALFLCLSVIVCRIASYAGLCSGATLLMIVLPPFEIYVRGVDEKMYTIVVPSGEPEVCA